MDGVLERIEEDDDQEASDEEDAGGKKSSGKNAQEGGRASVGRLKPQKQNSQIDLSNDPNQQQEAAQPGESKPQQEAESPPATSGTLELQILEADLERNLDTFGDQDPFAVLELGGQKHQTKTIDGGGKKPVWNEQAIFKVQDTAGALKVSVFDADNFSSEFNCGSDIPLQQLCQPGIDAWFELEY